MVVVAAGNAIRAGRGGVADTGTSVGPPAFVGAVGVPDPAVHTERGRWPTGRRHQPTAAVGVSRRCLRTLIKTPSGDQGATGLLCRSAGLPPPDRPRREMRQTDRWPSRPSALPSYLPGHQPGSCAITPSAGIAAGTFAVVLDVLAYVSLGAKNTADRPT